MQNINTVKEFNEAINNNSLVLFDFFATWCGPCKMLSPIIDEISKQYPSILVIKINVDNAQELAQANNILSIPTIILYANGKNIFQHVGFIDKNQLILQLKKYLNVPLSSTQI